MPRPFYSSLSDSGEQDPLVTQGTPGSPSLLADLALSPLRGLEGAVQDIYGLADTLTGDALPDYDERILGESQTFAGGISEGIFNFAAGFVPAVKLLGTAGKLSKGAQVAARTARGAKAVELGRLATAGAVADFAVFDGHEERLSDFLKEHVGLENAVTEFLAANENDHELAGRLKATVEGLGIGGLTDGLLMGLRYMKAARKVRAAGGTAQEAAEVAEKFAVQTDLDRALSGERTLGPDASLEELEDALSFEVNKQARAAQVAQADTDLTDRALIGEGVANKLRALEIDDVRAKQILSAVSQRKAEGLPIGVNPRERVVGPDGRKVFKYTQADLLSMQIKRGDLNLKNFEDLGADHLKRTLEDLYRPVIEADMGSLEGRPIPQVEREMLERLAGMRNEPIESTVAELTRGVDIANQMRELRLQGQVHTMRIEILNKDIEKTLAELDTPKGANPANKAKLAQQLEVFAQSVATERAISAEASRGLGERRARIPSARILDDPNAVQEVLEASGGDKTLDKLAARLKAAQAGSGAGGVADVLRGHLGQRVLSMTQEYWIGSILSGGKTFTINAVSNAVTAVYRPLERLIGAKLHQFTGGGDSAAREAQTALREFTAVLHGMVNGQTWKAAWLAGRENRGILTGGANQLMDVGPRKAITADALPEALQGTTVAAVVDGVGKAARLPGAALQGADEWAKTITYRAVAEGQLMQDAIAQGLQGDDVSKFVADRVSAMIQNGQAYSLDRVRRQGIEAANAQGIVDPKAIQDFVDDYSRPVSEGGHFDDRLSAISELALDEAAYATHTKNLDPRSLSAKFQNMVAAHPTLKFVAPFVRTPINIATFTAQRFDILGAGRYAASKISPRAAKGLERTRSRMALDLASGDARRIADAKGRMAIGISAAVTAYNAAESGLITGAGPADPEQRRLLEQSGWLPYSVKVGDTYVQFHRLDPFSSMLGIFADMAEFGRWGQPESSGVLDQLAIASATALAHNFTEKSYFTGISNFLNAMSDPERFMDKLLQRYAGSFVPNLLGQSVNPQFDDRLVDVRDWLDAMRAKTPGLSTDLETYRNVLGEPIFRQKAWGSDKLPVLDAFLPIAARTVSDSVVDRELAALGHGFTPPGITQRDIDLTEIQNSQGRTAYDRWSELAGTVSLQGRSLREELRKLFRSRRYKQMPEPDAFEGLDSPRISEVNRVIQRYRRAAWREVVSEYPELAETISTNTDRKRRARLGTLAQ